MVQNIEHFPFKLEGYLLIHWNLFADAAIGLKSVEASNDISRRISSTMFAWEHEGGVCGILTPVEDPSSRILWGVNIKRRVRNQVDSAVVPFTRNGIEKAIAQKCDRKTCSCDEPSFEAPSTHHISGDLSFRSGKIP
jgi:hypothetical protein